MSTFRPGHLTVVVGLVIAFACAGCGATPQPAASAAPPAAPQEPDTAPAGDADAPAAGTSETEAGQPDTGTTFQPEMATGAVKGVPAPTNTAPIVAVANYFTEFPGLDLAVLGRGQREKFLQQVNSELCPCGCKNDTLARCYVNDPGCQVARGAVQKLYEQAKSAR